jgi:recombination protein RecT
MSILSCAFLGESLKLTPSPQLGQYYMVPYEDKKNDRVVATFQLGYKGYIQLAIRSGYYKKINVISIKEGELKNFDPLNEEIECMLIEDVEARQKAATIGYYAMFEYLNGFRKAMFWPKAQMEAHAIKYSPGYAADKRKGTSWSFWSKEFDAMAYKTMLRQLISKWGIMSIELQNAFEKDMAFIDEKGNANYVENEEPQEEPTPDITEKNEHSGSDQELNNQTVQQLDDDDIPDFLK